jgi:hypothetical protein
MMMIMIKNNINYNKLITVSNKSYQSILIQAYDVPRQLKLNCILLLGYKFTTEILHVIPIP